MANHMTSIGFKLNTHEDFEILASDTVNYGEIIRTKNGQYSYFKAGKGIELWAQTNKQREIIGLNPHFSGNSRIKIALVKEVRREKDNILDGAFHAWADPTDIDPESGSYPFVFDTPNRAMFGEMKFPQTTYIQLSAFTHEISVYEDESDFASSQDGEIKFASESFIPSGLFSNESSPSATAIFTGKVIESSRIINPHAGLPFVWAYVRTLGGEIDVVIDEELINIEIKSGNIISGSFWLSGKFFESPQTLKTAFISKIFMRR